MSELEKEMNDINKQSQYRNKDPLLRSIEDKFRELEKIESPLDRIDVFIEYMKTLPLNTIDVPIFLANEIKKMWVKELVPSDKGYKGVLE